MAFLTEIGVWTKAWGSVLEGQSGGGLSWGLAAEAQTLHPDFSGPSPSNLATSEDRAIEEEAGGNEACAMQGIARAVGRFKCLIWSATIML